ncbi:MAG: FkbM family methyltransferase, partial [Clostridiales bacterium]|nr:FkbM family methyltransferase [Clostridiales bacterium]
MFENILEKESSWEYIKNSPLPFALYGTGNGADKVIRELDRYGLKAEHIIASDGFVRDRFFHGIKVKSAGHLEEEIGDFNILVCFASSRDEVINNINELSSRHTVLMPSVPVYGDKVFDKSFLRDNLEDIQKAYSLLTDDKSKKLFERIIEFQITGNISLLRECETDASDLYGLLNLSNSEKYLDLGAYRGDTIDEFIAFTGSYDQITAVEPDKRNFRKLAEHCESLKNAKLINALVCDKNGSVPFCGNKGRGSSGGEGENISSVTVDSLGEEFTYMKADIEGFEKEMLTGA